MERDQALEMALSQIEKNYGKGAIMRMGEQGHVGVAAIPTGALALDLALGIGGLPRGRVVEIFGPESSGKSTLAMHVVAEAQRNGGICAYIDAEHAMDPVYAAAIGVNVDDLLISQPDTGEQALEIADMLIRSGALDVIVIDSVAALVPRAEIEGEMGDSPRRPPGPAHVPGAAQAHRQPQPLAHDLHLHQPAAGEDRRDVRVLLLRHAGHARRRHAGEDRQDRQPAACRSRCSRTTPMPTRSCRRRSSTGSTTAAPTSSCSSRWPKPGGNGRAQFGCTPNHQIRTPGGWREAQELAVGDRVLQSRPAPPLRLPVGGRARWPDG